VELPSKPEMPTLSPTVAHNAVASLMAMYQGIIGDYERQLQLAQMAMRAVKAGEQAADQKIKKLEEDNRRLEVEARALHEADLPGIPDALAFRLIAAIGLDRPLVLSDEQVVNEVEKAFMRLRTATVEIVA
jgi:hypothetical protein